MENLSTGLMLMVVGMVTVFVILLIVIFFGKLLIATVNRVPDNEETSTQSGVQASAPVPMPAVAPVPAPAVDAAATDAGNVLYDLVTPVGGKFMLTSDGEGNRFSLPFRFKKGDVLCRIVNADGESALCAAEDGTVQAVLVDNCSRVDVDDVLMNITK